MSDISLNSQLKDLLARTTQLECSAGVQQVTNSLLQFNMMGYTYTAPGCFATIPFFNGIPMGFELMQALVGASVGQIYSQILMQLAGLLDVQSIMNNLVNEAETSAEAFFNSKISEVTNLINTYTAQVDALLVQITDYTNQINSINSQISNLQAQLVGETNQVVIDSINAQIASLNAQIPPIQKLKDEATDLMNSTQTYILDNLKNNVMVNLQSQLSNSIGIDISNIFSTQAKLSSQLTNLFKLSNPLHEIGL